MFINYGKGKGLPVVLLCHCFSLHSFYGGCVLVMEIPGCACIILTLDVLRIYMPFLSLTQDSFTNCTAVLINLLLCLKLMKHAESILICT